MMRIVITKDSDVFIATPVTFTIVPLTVGEALERNVIDFFPDLNDNSPDRAG